MWEGTNHKGHTSWLWCTTHWLRVPYGSGLGLEAAGGGSRERKSFRGWAGMGDSMPSDQNLHVLVPEGPR